MVRLSQQSLICGNAEVWLLTPLTLFQKFQPDCSVFPQNPLLPVQVVLDFLKLQRFRAAARTAVHLHAAALRCA